MSTVRKFFEKKIAAFAAANNIPVAYQGVGFTKPASGVYLETFVIPNTSTQREVSADADKVTQRGLYQVNVWVKSGQGLGAADVVVEQIVALFPVLPKLEVSIETPGNPGRPLSLDTSGWIAIPVVFEYRFN